MADQTQTPKTRSGKLVRLQRAFILLLAALVLTGPALTPVAVAEEADVAAPDFSAVKTGTAARRLVREGRLVEIFFFPTELGGTDDAENIGYITPEAAAARDSVIDTLGRQIESGLIDRLEVDADYHGDSIVPSRLTMTATHSERPGGLLLTIEVW